MLARNLTLLAGCLWLLFIFWHAQLKECKKICSFIKFFIIFWTFALLGTDADVCPVENNVWSLTWVLCKWRIDAKDRFKLAGVSFIFMLPSVRNWFTWKWSVYGKTIQAFKESRLWRAHQFPLCASTLIICMVLQNWSGWICHCPLLFEKACKLLSAKGYLV